MYINEYRYTVKMIKDISPPFGGKNSYLPSSLITLKESSKFSFRGKDIPEKCVDWFSFWPSYEHMNITQLQKLGTALIHYLLVMSRAV